MAHSPSMLKEAKVRQKKSLSYILNTMIWSKKPSHATVPLKGAGKGSGRNLIQEEKVETKAVGFQAREAVPLTPAFFLSSLNPILRTVWLKNHALTFNIYRAK